MAAITIPNILIKHQKEQTVIQLKKAYSDFSRAARMSSSIYGEFAAWDYSLSTYDFFKKYFYPYISLSKQTIADAQNDNIIYYQTSGDVESSLLLMSDAGTIIEMISGCQIFTYQLVKNSSVERKCYVIDINGYKKPNKFGRDLFMLCIYANKGVIPHHNDDGESTSVTRTREQLLNGPSSYSYNCNKKNRGMWCAALIMRDGWQIKDDYPW